MRIFLLNQTHKLCFIRICIIVISKQAHDRIEQSQQHTWVYDKKNYFTLNIGPLFMTNTFNLLIITFKNESANSLSASVIVGKAMGIESSVITLGGAGEVIGVTGNDSNDCVSFKDVSCDN